MADKIVIGELPHVWICSDWHFNHDKEFIWEARGFESVEQMNNAIIERHNYLVRPDEDVYVLGDLMLGAKFGLEAGLKLISHLNGKLHLVRGNHDTDNRWLAYSNLRNVVAMDNSVYLKCASYHFYMSHYPSLTGNNDKFLKQMTLNLFGHTHSKERFFEGNPWMYNVCMDAHNCYPCNLNDIIQEMTAKWVDNQASSAEGITPHDAVVNPNIPPAYEAWKKVDFVRRALCYKCVYEGECGGPSFLTGSCPQGYKYKRDPPDGGYYG